MEPASLLLTEVLKIGLPGVAMAAMAWVIIALWNDSKGHVKSRMEDQVKFHDKLANLVESSVSASKDLTNVVNLLREKIK